MQYEEVRKRSTRKLVQSRQTQNLAPPLGEDITEGDRFHDGHTVLESVTHWHQYLRNSVRSTDTITPSVLDLVDKNMLLRLADQRIKGEDLCLKLASTLKKCATNTEPQLPKQLEMLLGEIDMEASLRATIKRVSRHMAKTGSAASKIVTSGAQSPYNAERPLKTTHRQSLWPDQTLRLHGGKYPQALHLQTSPERLYAYKQPFQTPPETITHHRTQSNPIIYSTPSRSRQSREKKHRPQNYFQAREQLQKRDWSIKKFLRHEPKDGLLTSYFRGTRDIVSSIP